ncbi:peptidoglycan DD-metalloendopeptidase family protein [Sphingomicrobium sp. XHP0235]|uniref:murein hydrolase activator EnvC family protein n=1 Tax=Sphingomicrobium aquimarinum TaxID=3133971 RepID=UPI0031FEE69B
MRLLLAALAVGMGAQATATPQRAQDRLDKMRSEARAAQEEAVRLDDAARTARSERDRLAAEREAIVARIEALDTRIAAARLEEQRLVAAIGRVQGVITEQQRPAAALLAGLATLSRRPPVLTLAAAGSTEELMRTQALAESIVPLVEDRTRAIRGRAARLESLRAGLSDRRATIAREQDELTDLRSELAARIDRQASEARDLGVAAARADTRALASGEATADLADVATREAFAAEIAGALATYDPAPLPPRFADGRSTRTPDFSYRLPVQGKILAGLGSLSADGVRSRGLTVGSRRGADVRVPATGTIAFAGAFRDRDGVIVIDHGDGWTSLIANVATRARVGQKVDAGARLGSALGPVEVELWQERRPVSPALIAGSR